MEGPCHGHFSKGVNWITILKWTKPLIHLILFSVSQRMNSLRFHPIDSYFVSPYHYFISQLVPSKEVRPTIGARNSWRAAPWSPLLQHWRCGCKRRGFLLQLRLWRLPEIDVGGAQGGPVPHRVPSGSRLLSCSDKQLKRWEPGI